MGTMNRELTGARTALSASCLEQVRADTAVRAPSSSSWRAAKGRVRVDCSPSRLHPLERGGMLRHLLAVHDRFATGRDRIGIVEADRQSVHVRFFLRIDPAGFV